MPQIGKMKRDSEKRLKRLNFWNMLENIKHKEETVIMDREILGIDHGNRQMKQRIRHFCLQ